MLQLLLTVETGLSGHAYNPSLRETEAEGPQIQIQPILSQKTTMKQTNK